SERQRAQPKRYHLPIRRRKNEYPTKQRQQIRQRVEPDAIRSFQLGLVAPQQRDRRDLTDELNENSRCDQRVNHHPQREETTDDRDHTEHDQRNVRELLPRMKPPEDFEEIPVN